MEEKISVIVPIYKVEDYLHRCVESIINQTYTNLEIILVDDGSPDNCSKICDEYAEKDSRIKVIHKKNGGLSDARNAGLLIATGEYISFIDSDDYIDINMYKSIITYMEKHDLDIAECGIKHVYSNKIKQDDKLDKSIHVFNSEDALKELMLERRLHQTVWNKLYKTKLIKNIFFEKGKIHEDEFWTYKVFMNAEKIGFLDEYLYYYIHREGSIMAQGYSSKNLDGLEARYLRYRDISESYSKLSFLAKKTTYFYGIYLYQKYIYNTKNNKISMKKVKEYLKNISFNKKEQKLLNKKEKVWYFLSKRSIYLTCKLRNFINVGV